MLITDRSERQKLYRSKRWARIRREILERDGYRCRQCGRAGRLEVDHIEPMARGGSDTDSDNLQSLCRECHISKTARENRKPQPPEVEAWHALVSEKLR